MEWWGILFYKYKNLFTVLKIVFPILILFFLFYESKEIFKDFDWEILISYTDKLSLVKGIFIVILGLVSLLPMFFYDKILLQIFDIHIPKRKLVFYSLSANAFSNLVGFGGIAGATLRTYYYKRYVTDDTPYIQIIAKLSLFYLTGLSILSWFIVFSDLHVYAEVKFIKLAVWAVAAYAPILIVLFMSTNSFWNLKQLKRGNMSELVTISMFEWLFVVICIWGIAQLLGVTVPFSIIFPIVIISACAGIISMIPGGIGSFDLVFLIGMETKGVPAELSLLIIMFYRLSYYIIPALLGTPIVLHQFINKNK
ncbi:phosphatidylglycerol lysyltransferase [Cytobacillus eiseniae]|uniref:Phosphatidylglycerol lysyltransferase n=1 Tax=Cytobacillus eiseniae TaxID=762947 RepID=A0ABS4RA21_9BACI|nr:lysylphosphatidylglycerol synthase domain-containing protein [Cytobacillus eiseniae]MBP2239748.1 phosphatidylglycerol lysyltransferase [Cytobacillus eiseniae]